MKKNKISHEEKSDFWHTDVALWMCKKCNVYWSSASHGKKCSLCKKIKTVEKVDLKE
jgi:rubrerythrin